MNILTISPEYNVRMVRWLVGAYKLATHHTAFAQLLTGLGRLDCALRSADKPFYNFIHGGVKVGESLDVITDFPSLSGLWTMGMYEVLRTLHGKLKNDPKFGQAHPTTAKVKSLKIRFARVRMPLAKLEAASNFPTDYPYLTQNVGGPNGWGWVVAHNTVIYRNSLADEVLTLFDVFDDTKASLLFKKQLPNTGSS